MTNSEKAQEIVNKNFEWISNLVEENNLSKEDINQIRFKMYIACQEMAEWEEKQMIDKACEWLEDMACYYAHWEYNGDTYENEVVYDTEGLIKDFKKSMEEQL